MDDLLKLERNVRSIYARTLSLLASRYRFNLQVSDKDVPGSPRVLFLGNHSSGKSSFINYIAGADIQESGMAPTDDGFTLITYGEEKETLDGQTLVSHPELDYKDLANLGPEFLAKLKFKTYPSENLRTPLATTSSGATISGSASGGLPRVPTSSSSFLIPTSRAPPARRFPFSQDNWPASTISC